jgi:hypothetical protein
LYTVTFVERGLCGYGFEFDVHAISYQPTCYSNMTGSLFPFTSNPTMKLYAGRYWYGYHAYGSPFSGGEGNFTVSGPTTVYLNYSGVPANYCDNKQSVNASALNSNAINTTQMQNGTITGNTATIIVPSQNLTLTAGWSTRRISPLSIPMAQQVQATSYPVYIPVTITNNQSAPTPPGFQQQITIDAAGFSQYERGDLGNIRFYYEGSELYSWCESGCSNASADTIFWVKLPSQIPAQSSITLDMVFEQPTTGYDGVYAGEAPQLSPTYAEYDNGANVFIDYYNFAGTSLPSGFSQFGTGKLTVHNGLYLSQNSGDFGVDGPQSPFQYYTGDMLACQTYSGQFYGDGAWGDVDGEANYFALGDDVGTSHYAYGNYPGHFNAAQSGTPSGITPHVFTMMFSPGQEVKYMIDYAMLPDTFTVGESSSMQLGFKISGDNSTGFLQWARNRLTPPNGVMPGVSLGQAVQCQGAAGTQAAAGALGAPICTTTTSTTSTTTIPQTPTICSWFCSGYQVTFTETGLPEGGLLCFISLCSVPQWTVTLDGVSQSSTGTSMSFYAQTEVRLVPKKKADF